MATQRTIALVVLDGWGIGEDNESNPIHVVKPATFESLATNYPMASLQASGVSVGLPWGEVGNSEVGHLTLGAGKVVYQYYPKITMAIQDGTFFENPALKNAFAHAKQNNSAVNLAGLLTKANMHASFEHLEALLRMAEQEGVGKVNLHLFSDGKDSPPKSLDSLLARLPADKLATLSGRYYAMDRNENWPLVQKTYETLTTPGPAVKDLQAFIENIYARGYTEEYLPPTRVREGTIADGDALIFFNFREDSMRELASAFLGKKFGGFPVKRFQNLHVATFTRYAAAFEAPVAFPADGVELPLSAVLSTAGKTQLRLAETYKQAHVTSFFNGYREAPYRDEYRVLIPSLTLTKPEEHPELMAGAVTDRLVEALSNRGFDFILANYSNPDTIAHTGNYDACLEAVRVIDREIGRVVKAAEESGAVLMITSDHGNIEEVLNPRTGMLESQHDANPVPFYLIGPEFKGRRFVSQDNLKSQTTGIISDVAPTVLSLMGLPQPPEMTGTSLLRSLL